jgi:hypothetical protein
MTGRTIRDGWPLSCRIRLVAGRRPRLVGDAAAGVAVAAEPGPVVAGDFEPDPVSGWKRFAVAHRSMATCRPAGDHQLGVFPEFR